MIDDAASALRHRKDCQVNSKIRSKASAAGKGPGATVRDGVVVALFVAMILIGAKMVAILGGV